MYVGVLLFIYLVLCMWVFCLPLYVHNRSMTGTQRGQQTALDPLELQLQTVVSHHCWDLSLGSSERADGALNN